MIEKQIRKVDPEEAMVTQQSSDQDFVDGKEFFDGYSQSLSEQDRQRIRELDGKVERYEGESRKDYLFRLAKIVEREKIEKREEKIRDKVTVLDDPKPEASFFIGYPRDERGKEFGLFFDKNGKFVDAVADYRKRGEEEYEQVSQVNASSSQNSVDLEIIRRRTNELYRSKFPNADKEALENLDRMLIRFMYGYDGLKHLR